jgi:AraC-like DNA-binding protein
MRRESALMSSPASFPPLPLAEVASASATRGVANPFGIALGVRHHLRPGLGEGHRDFLAFPRGLQAAHSRFRPDVDSLGRCEGRDLFKMHFSLAGRNGVRYDGRPEHVACMPSVSISVHPAGVGKSDFHPRGIWEHSLTLACPADFLTEALRLAPESLPAPLARFASGGEPQLFFASSPLPGRARRLIEDLLDPPCESSTAHLHAEARVLDLLCLGLDLFARERRCSGRKRLSARDVQALQALRERVARDYLSPTSIAALARSAGMNRTKLTAGFRALFGESIGEYLTRLRMQYACRRLKEGCPASAVAAEIGYRHQSSFSTAFRAYLGRPPGQWKI